MDPAPPNQTHPAILTPSVGGPVSNAWRERTLMRAKELESLYSKQILSRQPENVNGPADTVLQHLTAAREAAYQKGIIPGWRTCSLIQRAMGNLDAAVTQILTLSPTRYLLGQMPSLLNHVQQHLVPGDPRRQDFERIVRTIEALETNRLSLQQPYDEQLIDKVEDERDRIVTIVRGASTAALREQLRVASFRNVLIVAIAVMILLAIAVALTGWLSPTPISVCFKPERNGQTMVVCPTGESVFSSTVRQPGTTAPDIDDISKKTAKKGDLLTIELIGLTAAAVAAAIRGIRGSSDHMEFPSCVDQQAHTVLNAVRGADKDTRTNKP